MGLLEEFDGLETVFIDTAPIIYYIEAHPQFGPLMKDIVGALESKSIKAYSSVITLTEVLPKPVKLGRRELVKRFTYFIRYSGALSLIGISADIAETAGKLRGKYGALRTLDAIQLAAAVEEGIEAFLTNDKKLKQVEEVKIICMKDYL